MKYDTLHFRLDDLELTNNILTFNSGGQPIRIPVGGFTTPEMHGATGNGVTDDTMAFLRIIADRPRLVVMTAGANYKISQQVQIDFPCVWIGNKAKITWSDSYHGFALTMWKTNPGAEGSVFRDIVWDHNAFFMDFPYFGGLVDILMYDTVAPGCDNVTWDGCEVHNSGCNGFGAQRYTYAGNGTQSNPYITTRQSFFPRYNRFLNCFSYEGGYLDNSDLSHFINSIPSAASVGRGGGAGLNLLAGSKNIVDNYTSIRQSLGITVDFGAGAVANLISNCNIQEAGNMVVNGSPGVLAGNGWGSWIGSAANSFSNMNYNACQNTAVIIDPLATRTTWSGGQIYTNRLGGMIIGGSYSTVSNVQFLDNSLAAPGVSDAVHITTSGGMTTDITLFGIKTQSLSSQHRYGLNISGPNALTNSGSYGCGWHGSTGDTNIGAYGFTVN